MVSLNVLGGVEASLTVVGGAEELIALGEWTAVVVRWFAEMPGTGILADSLARVVVDKSAPFELGADGVVDLLLLVGAIGCP